ncbi:type I-U CRISPR-associated helicase/endonuclease Cas3 [Micropruina sp.]|uniref:type I-G CRISPR-associated helicase/endonuclease Cas3g n=1 Tax=Micropruina sp. TaxID=2737536 RepID=UPI0039E3C1B9
MTPAPPSALAALSTSDFASYFSALWSKPDAPPVEPFGWQSALVEAAQRERRWPDLIDLPTGTGKTSAIDIAVFLLALGAEEPPDKQWHPRRIAVVVDRRVIVDQAADRARAIAMKLAEAQEGVLRVVADRLRSLAVQPDGSVPDVPLRHAVLRGGIVRDESWAQRPDIPAVLASTVDQVGSRLLFRGYGVSRGMRPIHAGLLSQDVLYLLDEVHLARPYAHTLQAVDRYRGLGSKVGALPDRWQLVRLSATVDTDVDWAFPGAELDTGGHPVLERRLEASKLATVELVKTPTDAVKAQQKLAAICAERAEAVVKQGARTVAIIVNRVATAGHAYAAVTARIARGFECDVALITGRMRPVDRDTVLADVQPRVEMGRKRRATDRPLILVSTQSIEAGADFDLDAIVTECASLDALRQRFGRVDRDGQLAQAGQPYGSVILASQRDVATTDPDPVYGNALRETWSWLSGLPKVDFGLRRLELPPPARHALMLPPVQSAPHLLPSHLDRWVRTSDYGVAADPEVAQWLHGIKASDAMSEVSVIWREDLDEALLGKVAEAWRAAGPDEQLANRVAARVNACPPMAAEALQVPVVSVRRWLRGVVDDPTLADAWAGHEVDDGRQPDDRAVVRWRDEKAETIRLRDIQPGDTILVPSTLGGLFGKNWNPAATDDVPDVAVEATGGRRTIVRLSRALDHRLRANAGGRRPLSDGLDEAPAAEGGADNELLPFPDPRSLEELTIEEKRAVVEAYVADAMDRADESTRVLLSRLLETRRWFLQSFVEQWASGEVRSSYVFTARVEGHAGGRNGTPTEDDGRDSPSFPEDQGRVLLTDHLDGVRRWAECLGRNLGLPDSVVASLGAAGQAHDLGKLDPRFQLWMHSGDDVSYQAEEAPLAKSLETNARWERDRARRRSGYPLGQRHELLSLHLLPLGGLVDAELVQHLVATHHGGGRYRFGPQRDLPEAAVAFRAGDLAIAGHTLYGLDRLDSGASDRFWNVVRSWGWFGLSWLEAILRLADHEDSRTPATAAQARRQS